MRILLIYECQHALHGGIEQRGDSVGGTTLKVEICFIVGPIFDETKSFDVFESRTKSPCPLIVHLLLLALLVYTICPQVLTK